MSLCNILGFYSGAYDRFKDPSKGETYTDIN
jgi:hypothetical protein